MRLPARKVKITSDTTKGTISLDGTDISNYVSGIHYDHCANELPRLTIDIIPFKTLIDGNAIPELPEPFNKWYELKEEYKEANKNE